MRRLILLCLMALPACAPLGRIINDPSRLCPPGHQLMIEDGQPVCRPRPRPEPKYCGPGGPEWPGNEGCVPCPDGTIPYMYGTRDDQGRPTARAGCAPTPRPSAAPTATPTQGTPTSTPTAVNTATPTPTPTASVPPTPTPAGHCMLGGPPWTRPAPPSVPVPVLGTFGERCPAGFRRVGPDRSGQLGCVIDWACAAGTNGRSPAEGAAISLRHDHLVIDSDGYIRDVDNGVPCAMDAWGRKVCAGEIREALWEGRPEKWWAQHAACDPVACAPEPTPAPTAGPPPPSTGESCVAPDGSGCSLVCTVAFLGWNDREGIPPTVVVGGAARLDVTCRRATSHGDSRGQPVDRFGPEHCEPDGDPVAWRVETPRGSWTSAERDRPSWLRVFNDGYGLDLDDLQPGGYRIEVTMNRAARDRKGQPLTFCGWGHGSSTRTVLEFGL